MNLIRGNPSAALPSELLPYPPPELSVVRELGFPLIRHRDADQFVFVIVIETARAIARQVTVEIVNVTVGCGQTKRDAAGVLPPITVFRDSGESVVAVC